jgi:CopG family nickel-responsive transcriptional regulator
MIRQQLVGRQWQDDRETLGTVTLLYNHHLHKLSEKLTDLQHHHHENILVSTHVHLDKDLCAEVLLVKGRATQIRRLANLLRQQKGVLHGALSISSTGKSLV